MKGVVFEATGNFGTGYPKDVPLAEGIVLDELTSGDTDPMFLTLPVGEIGAVSRNGRHYDRAAVEAIRDAVMVKRIGGILGHLRDTDRPYDYQTSAIHWIGAVLEGTTLWAKGYIPRTETKLREEMRIAKLKRGRVGTSIYGTAAIDDDGNVTALDVESIDIAHPDRVGVPMTAATPIVTSETLKEGAEFGARLRRAVDQKVQDTPKWDEIIARLADAAGLTLEELYHLLNTTDTVSIPDATLQAWATVLNVPLEELRRLAGIQVSETRRGLNMGDEIKPVVVEETAVDVLKRQHQQEVRELNARLLENKNKLVDYDQLAGLLKDNKDPVTALRVLMQTVDDLRRENGDLLQEAIRGQVDNKVVVPMARPLIISMVKAANPATRSAVVTAVETVLAREDVKEMLRAGVAEAMGPKHETPTTPTPAEPAADALRIVIPGVN